MIRTSKSRLAFILLLFSALAVSATSNGAWINKVPERDRDKQNPYGNQADAIAAGQRIFHDHCAHCHGADAEGTKNGPR